MAKNLPLVLLGLRNSVSADTNLSAAQAVYGRPLNVPNCIFEDIGDIWSESTPKRAFSRANAYIPKDLTTCEYIWVKKPTLGSSLSRPYIGPFKVISKDFDKHVIVVLIKGQKETIAMERVKPAIVLEHIHTHTLTLAVSQLMTVLLMLFLDLCVRVS